MVYVISLTEVKTINRQKRFFIDKGKYHLYRKISVYGKSSLFTKCHIYDIVYMKCLSKKAPTPLLYFRLSYTEEVQATVLGNYQNLL